MAWHSPTERVKAAVIGLSPHIHGMTQSTERAEKNRLCSPEVLLSICLRQFSPAGAVSIGEAHSPGVASLRLGIFNLGPAGALSVAAHASGQKSCLPGKAPLGPCPWRRMLLDRNHAFQQTGPQRGPI